MRCYLYEKRHFHLFRANLPGLFFLILIGPIKLCSMLNWCCNSTMVCFLILKSSLWEYEAQVDKTLRVLWVSYKTYETQRSNTANWKPFAEIRQTSSTHELEVVKSAISIFLFTLPFIGLEMNTAQRNVWFCGKVCGVIRKFIKCKETYSHRIVYQLWIAAYAD